MLTMGLDIGTTTICGVLLDAVTGETVATLTLPNDAALPPDCEGARLQNPERILAVVDEIIRTLGKAGKPLATGVTGQMHGIVYLDAEGRALSPLYTWQDGRGDLPARDGGESCASRLSRITGTAVATGYGLSTMLYNSENNLAPRGAVAVCTIADYLTMALAGRKSPRLDRSMASSLGGFDLRTGAFLAEIPDSLSELLPAVCRSGAVLGGNIPVTAACGDHQASFLSAVASPETQLAINIGTSSQISVYHKRLLDVKGVEARSYFNNGYLYTGASLNGGCVYRALYNFFEQCCLAFGTAPSGDIYEVMNRLAAEPKRETLRAEVSLNGSRLRAATGSITSITSGNLTPSQLVKAFLGGMAAELRDYRDSMPQEVLEGKTALALSGNAVRCNPALRARLEEELGLTAQLAPEREDAACGAAIVAAAGTGLVANRYI